MSSKNAVILGVSFDPVDENDAFAKKFSFPFKLLSDTKRDIGVKYGAADSTGAGNAKRVAYIIGPDGKVRNVFPKANTQTFAQDCLALL